MPFTLKLLEDKKCIYGEELLTPKGRAQHVHLVTPTVAKGFEDSKPKYRIVVCVPKDLSNAKEAEREHRARIIAQCNEMFAVLTKFLWEQDKDKKKTKLSYEAYCAEYMAQMKFKPFRDGDTSGDFDGYPGSELIVANNPNQDRIVFLDGKDPQDFKAGQIVRAQVQPCLGGQGFSYTLTRIRIVGDDGTRYASGGGPDLLSAADDADEIRESLQKRDNALSDAYDEAVESDAPAEPVVPAAVAKPAKAEKAPAKAAPAVSKDGLGGVFG